MGEGGSNSFELKKMTTQLKRGNFLILKNSDAYFKTALISSGSSSSCSSIISLASNPSARSARMVATGILKFLTQGTPSITFGFTVILSFNSIFSSRYNANLIKISKVVWYITPSTKVKKTPDFSGALIINLNLTNHSSHLFKS